MASDPVHPLGFVATDSPAGCTGPHRFTGGGLRLGITAARLHGVTMASDPAMAGGAKQDPCQLRDGQDALEHLCRRLGIDEGGTTAPKLCPPTTLCTELRHGYRHQDLK